MEMEPGIINRELSDFIFFPPPSPDPANVKDKSFTRNYRGTKQHGVVERKAIGTKPKSNFQVAGFYRAHFGCNYQLQAETAQASEWFRGAQTKSCNWGR